MRERGRTSVLSKIFLKMLLASELASRGLATDILPLFTSTLKSVMTVFRAFFELLISNLIEIPLRRVLQISVGDNIFHQAVLVWTIIVLAYLAGFLYKRFGSKIVIIPLSCLLVLCLYETEILHKTASFKPAVSPSPEHLEPEAKRHLSEAQRGTFLKALSKIVERRGKSQEKTATLALVPEIQYQAP